MAFLLDTGILLRLINEIDPLHVAVRDAVDTLIARQEDLFITKQNIAELWNVATRPLPNFGLALSPAEIGAAYEDTIDPLCGVLTEADFFPDLFRRLLVKHHALGKQVHDARLVAMMLSWQVDKILTLNERDFFRYQAEGITVITPASPASPGP
jgi:predicted nucleic acid-binding protein